MSTNAQVQLQAEKKMEKERSKNLGKSNAKAKAVEDNGLEIHEFLECLVNLAFSRANPKYGQVGKSDVAAGGIEMDLLPGCLESLLKTNILVKAKRDNVPAWMDEIVSSAECQKAILDRREKMRMCWRDDAGKGEQGSQMDNKTKGHCLDAETRGDLDELCMWAAGEHAKSLGQPLCFLA